MRVDFYRYESTKETYSLVSDVLDQEAENQVELLEEEFASYIGSEYALATSSGTGALHLAMLSLDLKRGDKVVCSVNAHPSVPEVVRHFDAEPIFIDVDIDSFNIDLDKLEEYLEQNIAKKLKGVIITHIAGQCVDLSRVYSMAKKYDIKVVEDASEALGATYNGEKIGSLEADIVCFNFSNHLKKNACNGGMLVTNSKELIDRARLLNSHGLKQDKNSLNYIYDVVDIGFEYTMGELDAAYFRAYISEFDKNISRVKAIAKRYNEALDGVDHITIPFASSDEHPYSLYIIKVDKNRDSFAKELDEEGVEVGVHYIPLHFLSYYKNKYNLKINNFPNALKIFQKIMSLPIYPYMSDEEVEFVIKKVKLVASTRV